MMNNLTRRIEKLEKNITDQSVTAVAEDGQQIRIRRANLLPLATAAFRRRYAEIDDAEPMPVSRFDSQLDHLKSVGLRSASEPLLQVAVDVLRTGDR
jgi:hypothetical protein